MQEKLTQDQKKERKRERAQKWKSKLIRERRCHWCGEPSSPEYRNACEKHLAVSRATTKRSMQRIYKERKEKGICTVCGQRPAVFGYLRCNICRARSSEYEEQVIAKKAMAKFDALVEADLVSIKEAAYELGVQYKTVRYMIKNGTLHVSLKTGNLKIGKRIYLDLNQVKAVERHKQKLLNITRECQDCYHHWHPRKLNVKQPKCTRSGCRSYNIKTYNGNKPRDVLFESSGKRICVLS